MQLLYALMWLVVASVHFMQLHASYGFQTLATVVDSIVVNLIFAILGVGLWFSMKFSQLQKKNWIEIFIQHLTTCAILIILWLLISNALLSTLLRPDEEYQKFLEHSLTMRVFTGLLYYGLLVAIFYLVAGFRELQEKTRREAQLTSMLKEAELDLLRSQIRPHFLFNSLNAISSLTMTRPEQAQEMVIKLSEFMRYSLSHQGEMISTFEKELYHIRLYLDIEQVRFAGKLKISNEIDKQILGWEVPSMILQPLIENCIKYGVYSSEGESWIKLNARRQGAYLLVLISNTYDPENTTRKGTGTGLRNVGRRLETIYNEPGLMQVVNHGSEFEVHLKIPENANN